MANLKYLFFDSSIGYILQIIPFVTIIGIIYWILRGIWLKKRGMNRNRFIKEIALLLYVCYISGLLMLVATPDNFWAWIWFKMLYGYSGVDMSSLFSGEFNFVPSVFQYIAGTLTGGSWSVFMLLGNVLLYLPFGVLLPLVWKKRTSLKYIGIGIITTVGLELIQPIVGRSFDIDDIIMNIIGFLVGYFLYIVCNFIYYRKHHNEHTT